MSETVKEYVNETIEITETGKELSKDTQTIQIDEDTLIEIERMLELENVEARTIYLNDQISVETVEKVVPLIHLFNREDEGLEDSEKIPIKIYVNTVGGELYNGAVIQAAMENSKTPVHTYLEGGIAMSMGLILFLAGDVRFMSKRSHLLFHELRSGSDTSTLAEMKNTIKHYSNLQDKLDEFIVSRTTIPLKKLKKQRKKNLDWYIDFDTAKKYSMFDVEI